MIVSYIKKYILENRQVKIYRLGTFELQYREAGVHPILKEFTPPGDYLCFTPDESEEGADFVRYIASETKVDQAAAVERVAQWVETVKHALETEKRYDLGSMGQFVMGNVRMEFVPALDPELSPESFGFSSFTLRNDGSEKAAEGNIVNENVVSENVTNGSSEKDNAAKENASGENVVNENIVNENAGKDESRPKRHAGRTIFYILLILLLLCVIAMGVFALLRPVEFVEKKDYCLSKITEWFHPAADTAAVVVEEPDDVYDWGDGLTVDEPAADTLETETDTIAPVVPADANCYVIIGGFGNSANADNLVRSLKGRYPNVCNLGLNKRGSLTMVGLGPYNHADAEARVAELTPIYKDCWILEK